MIETLDSARLKSPLIAEGLNRWRFAYMQSNKHWFYVDYSLQATASISEVIMLGTEEDLLLFNEDQDFIINRLYLVSPPHFNASKRWKMEEVISVFNVTSSNSKHVLVELADGRTYQHPANKKLKKTRETFPIYAKANVIMDCL